MEKTLVKPKGASNNKNTGSVSDSLWFVTMINAKKHRIEDITVAEFDRLFDMDLNPIKHTISEHFSYNISFCRALCAFIEFVQDLQEVANF